MSKEFKFLKRFVRVLAIILKTWLVWWPYVDPIHYSMNQLNSLVSSLHCSLDAYDKQSGVLPGFLIFILLIVSYLLKVA